MMYYLFNKNGEQAGFVDLEEQPILSTTDKPEEGQIFNFHTKRWYTKPVFAIAREEINKQIKVKAGEIITAKYSIVWQLNHPRIDENYKAEYEWIDNIRNLSNEVEANNLTVEEFERLVNE